MRITCWRSEDRIQYAFNPDSTLHVDRPIFATEPLSFSQYEGFRNVVYIKQSCIHETATIAEKAVAALPEEKFVGYRLPPDFRNVSLKPSAL